MLFFYRFIFLAIQIKSAQLEVYLLVFQSFDKQFVRDWLKANPDSDYLLPDDVIEKTVEKYKEAYKLLTGKDFSRK